MIRGTTLPKQTLPLLAAAALLLPAIIALAVWFHAQQGERRGAIETQALDSARKVIALSDAEITANMRVLAVMAGSPVLQGGQYQAYRDRVARVVHDNPDWNALLVRDARSGAVLLEIAGDAAVGRDRPLRPLLARPGTRPLAEGAFRDGRYCPCVVVDVAAAGPHPSVMSLYLSPAVFQRILQREAPFPQISAIADRDGRFVARTLNYAQRVGTPGSRYLRGAVAKGSEGIYRGVTLEGFRNYTAYATSPQTGFSAHVAVDSGDIDSPRTLANAALVLGVLAALVLAAGLLVYAVYEVRRRRLEETRLIGMQKAEAISRFTGILAHDFRNILSVIDAGVRLIERHTQEEETGRRVRAIGNAAERGNRLINQLLSFVRGEGATVERLDLNQCFASCEELLRNSLGEDIRFTWTVEEGARFARANADQLELALLNLAINARDAMDGRGEFSLTAKPEDDFVAIVACDSGPGVPAHLHTRIFEAFYSTKGDGKGTGLGLAQVAGAARQAGGRVELRTADNGGACFVIYLPRAEASEG